MVLQPYMKCIVKVVNKANLNEKTKYHAIDVTNNVTQKEISTGKKSYGGLAATVLYISCIKTGEHKTQRDIAQAAGITDVTSVMESITTTVDYTTWTRHI